MTVSTMTSAAGTSSVMASEEHREEHGRVDKRRARHRRPRRRPSGLIGDAAALGVRQERMQKPHPEHRHGSAADEVEGDGRHQLRAPAPRSPAVSRTRPGSACPRPGCARSAAARRRGTEQAPSTIANRAGMSTSSALTVAAAAVARPRARTIDYPLPQPECRARSHKELDQKHGDEERELPVENFGRDEAQGRPKRQPQHPPVLRPAPASAHVGSAGWPSFGTQ